MKVLTSYFIFALLSVSLSAELIDQQIANEAEIKYDRFAKNRFMSIKEDLLNGLRDDSDIRKLNVVNTWMNEIRYKSDKQVYGVSDYWATLYEFVGKNKGDCEDYTIAKYYVLKELGVDPNRMKFTYVIYQDRRGKNISHMVLAYFSVPNPTSKDEILILGNNNRLVLPASKRPDIVKVVKMINGDTGAKSKKWKILEEDMKRKKL
jgi:predicted transglutaminase-like cysteine proteinase